MPANVNSTELAFVRPLAECHATRLWSSMRQFLAITLPLWLFTITALADDEIAVAASLQTFVEVCGPLVAPTRLTRQGKELLTRAPRQAGKRRWATEIQQSQILPEGCEKLNADLTGDNPMNVGYPLLILTD